MIEHLCKECGTSFHRYNSTQTRCDRCSYNRYTKPRKPIKRMGKIAKKWAETRRQYVTDNPPDENGNWMCYLNIAPDCYITVNADTLNVEHMKSRARHPELRFEQTNLAPACPPCNALKGSRDADEFKKIGG